MEPKSLLIRLLMAFAFLDPLACNMLIPAATPTVVIPSPIPPTATPPLLLSQQVTLVSQALNETNQMPPFRITAQIPQLTGSNDTRVTAFNQRLNELVSKEVDAFRQSFLQNTLPPVTELGSFVEATSSLLSQTGEIWSFKFDFSFYSDGAAHPGHYSITLNYDLSQAKELTLADLFLPGSSYLETISNYCITELSKQPGFEGPFQEGASPTLENYRNWNITPDALLITFDEYQVAPYASGPQTVLVPYRVLQAVIDPHGPVGSLIQ